MSIPIIKTFVCEGKYFFYDTYTNSIFNVTKAQFSEINELQRIGVSAYKKLNKNSEEYTDILMLIKRGLFKEGFLKEIEHPATKHLNVLLDRCVNDITLQVTRDCNFRCRYCLFANNSGIERNHEKIKMPWEIAKKSIDYLYDHSKDIDIITVAFYGGEPMLNFELIKNVVEYTKQRFFIKKIEFRMTINGSILSDIMIDFLIKNQFYISFSLDGPKTIQDKHRRFLVSGKGTYDIVIENIMKLKKRDERFFFNNVTFMPVMFPDENEKDVEDYFESLGIKANQVHFLEADLTGVDYISNQTEDYTDARLNFTYDEDSYYKKILIPAKWHHNGPCIPGIKSVFVDVNGDFYPCEGFINNKELAFGNIEKGIDISKVSSLINIGKLTENECRTCWLMRFCKTCALNCIDVDKNIISKEQKKISCDGQEERALMFLKRTVTNKEKKERNIF